MEEENHVPDQSALTSCEADANSAILRVCGVVVDGMNRSISSAM
jgi:hypothetical protein